EHVSRGFPLRLPLCVEGVEARLNIQRLNQRVRVEEQLQNWLQQSPHQPQRSTMRFEQRVLFKRVVGQLRRTVWRLSASELLEQIGAHPARIQKLFELDCGQLMDLLFGVVGAALLADAR